MTLPKSGVISCDTTCSHPRALLIFLALSAFPAVIVLARGQENMPSLERKVDMRPTRRQDQSEGNNSANGPGGDLDGPRRRENHTLPGAPGRPNSERKTNPVLEEPWRREAQYRPQSCNRFHNRFRFRRCIRRRMRRRMRRRIRRSFRRQARRRERKLALKHARDLDRLRASSHLPSPTRSPSPTPPHPVQAPSLAQSTSGRPSSTKSRTGLATVAVAGIAVAAALLVSVVTALIIVHVRRHSVLRTGSSSSIPFLGTDETSPPQILRGSSATRSPPGAGDLSAVAVQGKRDHGSDPPSTPERDAIPRKFEQMSLPPPYAVGDENVHPGLPSAPNASQLTDESSMMSRSMGSTIAAPEYIVVLPFWGGGENIQPHENAGGATDGL